MSRQRHGAVLNAPAEDGFVPGQASEQGDRKASRASASSVPALPSPRLARLCQAAWSSVKLMTGVFVVVLASVAVAWGAHRYALTTPRFSVRRVEVRGNRRLTAREVETLAGVHPGQNIFAVDTDAAERRVLGDPWVKEVKITRHLPGTLSVDLTERDAGALAAIGGGLYLVTVDGQPFKRLARGDPDQLPVITGVTPEELTRDRAGAVTRIAVGLEILGDYRRLPMSRFYPAEEVHLSEAGDAVLTIGKSGITVYLGDGPFKKKLLMAARVMHKLAAVHRVPGIIFVDNRAHPERVVVRMR